MRNPDNAVRRVSLEIRSKVGPISHTRRKRPVDVSRFAASRPLRLRMWNNTVARQAWLIVLLAASPACTGNIEGAASATGDNGSGTTGGSTTGGGTTGGGTT